MVTYIYGFSSSEELKVFIEKHEVPEKSDAELETIVVNRGFVLPEDEEKKLKADAESKGLVYLRRKPEENMAIGYTEGMNIAKGDYICFTLGGAKYDSWVHKAVNLAAKRYPEREFFEINSIIDPKEIPAKDLKKALGEGDVIQTERIDIPEFRLFRFFVRKDVAKELGLKKLTIGDMSFDFTLRLVLRNRDYIMLSNCNCIPTGEAEDIYTLHNSANEVAYYEEALDKVHLPLLEGIKEKVNPIPKWIQLAFFYNISEKIHENLNNPIRLVLDGEEADAFFSKVSKVMKYIDDDVILDNISYKKVGLRFIVRNLLCYLKYDGKVDELGRSFIGANENLIFKQRGIEYNLKQDRKFVVKTMHILKNELVIAAWFMTHMLTELHPNSVVCRVNDIDVPITEKHYYGHDKVFDRSINKKYIFEVRIPIEELFCKESKIAFYISLEGIDTRLPLDFNRMPSKLTNECEHRYWPMGESHVMTYSDNCLWVKKVTKESLKKLEDKYQKDASLAIRRIHYDEGNSAPTRLEGIKIKIKGRLVARRINKLRDRYFIEKEKLGSRRIWLYFDKLFKAGDNGEYAFRYAYNNDKSIESYYVINKDSPDYKRLKKEFGNRILVFGDEKTKLYALLAETVVATHPDIMDFFGYTGYELSLMKNLFNPYLVCIAHGVTIQKNADYQNKLFDDTMFYTTSSKYEVEHILHPAYGYEPDDVALTGMARFDGLISNDKKQILITPTWRRSLVGSAERNTTREYNDAFKKTDYYKIYNALINDERLIESAKRNGYRIIFLVHPSMSTQAGDYDKNDYVDIIPASGDMSYEKILTESSLMVTDYSGIHYDFGYMRKPVIYYQPKEIPMRFEEGGMKFATMGFGPLTTEYEEAVRLMMEYMDNGCKMPDVYRMRADDFFAFEDHNNSQRIHYAIKEWVDDNNGLNSLVKTK